MSLLQMSFSGALMISVIAVLRAFCINKLPKRTFVLLWEFVFLRLLLPVAVPSSLSVYSLLERKFSVSDMAAQGASGNAVVLQAGTEQLMTDGSVSQGLTGSQTQTSVWLAVWLTGMVLCAGFLLASYLHWYRQFRLSVPVDNAAMAECLKELSLKHSARIRQSGRVSAPLTYGVLRPVILMPENMDWENRERVKYVLLHESTHIRHHDILSKLAAACVLCVHWFNPAVWLMYVLFNRDVELACDESVLRRMGDGSKAAYARTLIAMEEQKSGPMPVYNHFSKNATEERIVAIMRSKKITIGAIAVSVVVAAVIAVLFAASPEAKEGQKTQMIFCDQKVYVSTQEDVSEMVAYEASISEYDSPYIGVIGSTVEESETPAQELQSNFGYVGSEIIFNGSGIAVNMDGKWIQFLPEGTDLSVFAEWNHLRNRLANSIAFSGDSINFTIPESDHDWHIQINGREEREGFGGMSVHYLQERTEADDWKSGETYSFPVDAAVCTELYMEVSIDSEGETAIIDLTDYISVIPYVF